MPEVGCLYCQDQQKSYSRSGADIDVSLNIFYGAYLTVVDLLEDPWQAERYPSEKVLQCEHCNSIWHLEYSFPGKPPLFVTAHLIPKAQLPDFFGELGQKMSDTYTRTTKLP